MVDNNFQYDYWKTSTGVFRVVCSECGYHALHDKVVGVYRCNNGICQNCDEIDDQIEIEDISLHDFEIEWVNPICL